MGINNLKLSQQMLAAIYPDSLVIDDKLPEQKQFADIQKNPDSKKPERQPVPAYPFLGKNLRKICFLVNYPEDVFLPEDQLTFLSKMLGACNCTIADVALINTARTTLDHEELKKQLNPESLFLCGISPDSVNIRESLTDFSINELQGISTILLPPLHVINQETVEAKQFKSQLWSCLQKLFKL